MAKSNGNGRLRGKSKKTRRIPRARTKPKSLAGGSRRSGKIESPETHVTAAEALRMMYKTGVAPGIPAQRPEAIAGAIAGPPTVSGEPLSRIISAPPALAISQGTMPADSPVEPILDIHEIQGNSLVGFNKDYQTFLFFRITSTTVAKLWIKQLTPRIATVAETLAWSQLYRAVRSRTGAEPSGMVATWLNIAFTNNGIRLLRGQDDLDQFTDDAFKRGMDRRAALLHDPVDTTPARNPAGWVIGTGNSYPDVLVIVASDTMTARDAEVGKLLDEITQLQGVSPTSSNNAGLELILQQEGEDLHGGLKGHEHFGFKDGISQPGIRGRIADQPEAFLTPRWIDLADDLAKSFARPGQPLIWPGQFVLGQKYPRQKDNDRVQPGVSVLAKPGWAENGSFLVFRRLKQDVQGFWAYMHEQSKQLAKMPAFAGMNAIRLASLCVGRWPSGAPLMRAPLADSSAVASNETAINNFNFSGITVPVKLRPDSGAQADEFSPIPGDNLGVRCPFASHLRKVNPRDQNTNDLGPSERALLKRVLRRGIPFGAPMTDPLNPIVDSIDRGLLFIAYQSSIVDQFEFLQAHWTNSSTVPNSYSTENGAVDAGHDLVMGQAAGTTRERIFTVPGEGNVFDTLKAPNEFVTTTGGGYFFSPSISALRQVLSAS